MRNQTDADDMIRDLNRSLAHQVQEEMHSHSRTSSHAGRNNNNVRRKKKKRKMPVVFKVLLTLLVLMVGFAAFLIFTKPGRNLAIHFATEYAYSKLEYAGEEGTGTEKDGTVITANILPSTMSPTFRAAKHEEGVINILLLGVEAIGYAQSSGHTDSIMIATMNINTGELKLTSLLRDSWVTIPDYGDDRINIAYAKGGIKTVYETIALNYDLQLDGYVLVGFEAFEQIIDTIGGIEIELTEEEAYYLNHTNYISKKANRTVVAGKQRMNGNQVLGYCRVRKVATLDGSNYDMGRTSRQRRVINAIFSELKSSNITELVSVMNHVLPLVETDIRKSNCKAYLSEALEIGLKDRSLETLRLPEDDGYDSTKINGKSVLVPHWEDTKQALYEFIFPQETVTDNALDIRLDSNSSQPFP